MGTVDMDMDNFGEKWDMLGRRLHRILWQLGKLMLNPPGRRPEIAEGIGHDLVLLTW